MGTDISDLKGLFNFLRLHPFTNKNFFNSYVKPAYGGSAWARQPAHVVLYMLSQCMIRHTKLQVRPCHSCELRDIETSCKSVCLKLLLGFKLLSSAVGPKCRRCEQVFGSYLTVHQAQSVAFPSALPCMSEQATVQHMHND